LLNISSSENIFLVTSKKYEDLIKSEIPEIPVENILYEPSARNTTAAIYYALETIKLKNNSSVVGVYPADHYIKSEQDFVASVKEAHDLITKYKERVYTFGIKPNYPSTSYGYIQCDADNENSYKVAQFCEKPDLDTAKFHTAIQDCETLLRVMKKLKQSKANQIYESYQKTLLRLEKILRRHKRKIKNHHQLIHLKHLLDLHNIHYF